MKTLKVIRRLGVEIEQYELLKKISINLIKIKIMRSRTHSNLFYRFILKMKIVLMFFLFVHSLFGQSFVLPAVTPMIVIGGIYYGKTAVINKNDNLKMQLAILDYDLSTQTMKMQFGNKAYYSNIPTWQLIPLVKYVESNDPIILSITIYTSLIVSCYFIFIFVPKNHYYFEAKNQLISLLSFLILSAIGFLVFKNLIILVIAFTISSFIEIVYCRYLIKKHKLL